MRNLIKIGLLSALALVALTAVAYAASAPWTANPGASFDDGIVTLDSTGGGTSLENTNLEIPVDNGDEISFEWRSDDVACAGGVPRIFIQGGAYNTFDQAPAAAGACGTDSDGDGWNEVTGTISGITPGDAGYVGIVNDNPADPGTIQVRNVVINDVAVFECKDGGWSQNGYKNQGACVSGLAQLK